MELLEEDIELRRTKDNASIKGFRTEIDENFLKEFEFEKKSQWHYWRPLIDGILHYWPTTNKWHYRGLSYQGTKSDLKQFILNRTAR